MSGRARWRGQRQGAGARKPERVRMGVRRAQKGSQERACQLQHDREQVRELMRPEARKLEQVQSKLEEHGIAKLSTFFQGFQG